MEILNDLRTTWFLTEETITDIVSTRVWKYSCRTVDDGVFGVSGLRALVLDILPGFNNNPMSSQHNAILEVKYYASNTISSGKKTKDDAEDRCWDMYYTINPVLNRISRETKTLTDFLVLGIFRNGEPGMRYDEEMNCPYLLVTYEFQYLISS